MGVNRLMQLLKELCPEAVKEIDLKSYKDRSIAIDAYLTIYQYIIATQTTKGDRIIEMRDKENNLTAHLLGILNRSVTLMQNGIKPCWVFDGCPPTAKTETLKKRFAVKEEANKIMNIALKEGDMDQALKFANRSTKITNIMISDAKKLIKLLGLPCVEAPGESEAQCAALTKSGKVYATCTEDLDCLLFGSTRMLKGFSNSDQPCVEINLEVILDKLNINYTQFIDLCILSGCDYSIGVKGIGVFKALELVKEYKNIESVLNSLNKCGEFSGNMNCKEEEVQAYDYEIARYLFQNPDIINPNEINLKWDLPDYDKLIDFLCYEKNFNFDKIEAAFNRLKIYDKIIADTKTPFSSSGKRKQEVETIFQINLKCKKNK